MKIIECHSLEMLYDRELIAFGTGETGKKLIPVLEGLPRIKLCGVTNSKACDGTDHAFCSTKLSVRSIRDWAEIVPDAAILITAKNEYCEEIVAACRENGFKEAFFFSPVLLESLYMCVGMQSEEHLMDVSLESRLFRGSQGIEHAPMFKERLVALTRGLDEESIANTVLAIKRKGAICRLPISKLPYCSLDERERCEACFKQLRERKIRLDANCYFYNGYLLPVDNFTVEVFWDKCNIGELEHPERIKDGDIIDAGAYIGDSALILSTLTNGSVHAFEPDPENYKLMLETIRLNANEKIIPCKYALGEQSGHRIFPKWNSTRRTAWFFSMLMIISCIFSIHHVPEFSALLTT